MKGIILAGGSGTRLYPITRVVSKQLLPVYDKPMIYYPLSVLMLAGLREILIISTPKDLPNFKALLGDGSQLGISFKYIVQPTPGGLAQALTLGKNFIGKDNICLILGDNIFYGHGVINRIKSAIARKEGATVFGYQVKDPERYGVVTFDEFGKVVDIVEKPDKPESNWAVTGLYLYDQNAVEIAENLTPSSRGELEITDVNRAYLEAGNLFVEKFGRGTAWLDTGTHESLMQASGYIEAIEQRQGLKVACIEEIAYTLGHIGKAEVRKLAKSMLKNGYGQYLLEMLG